MTDDPFVVFVQALDHDGIKNLVAEMLRRNGWRVEDLDSLAEGGDLGHGLDLRATRSHGPHIVRIGLQVKTREAESDGLGPCSDVSLIASYARRALHWWRRFGVPDSRLDRFYWVINRPWTSEGAQSLLLETQPDDLLAGRVDVWDSIELARWLRRLGAGPNEEHLSSDMCRAFAEAAERESRWMQAAYYRRHIVLVLKQKNADIEHLRRAANNILIEEQAEDGYRFRRTAHLIYEAAARIAATAVEHKLDPSVTRDRSTGAVSQLVLETIKDPLALAAYDDIDLAISQLSAIRRCDRIGSAPSLSHMERIETMLRVGLPDDLTRVRRYAAMILREITASKSRSIHEECTLCSGTAVSLLTLAGHRLSASQVVSWLRTLKKYRYAHRSEATNGPRREEHSLHYAAAVLSGFIDWGASSELVTSVWKIFDSSDLSDWLRYRNNTESDILRYILNSFLHFALARPDGELPKTAMTAVRRLVEELVRNSEQSTGSSAEEWTRAGAMYASRQSLQALTVGVMLGDERAIRLAIGVRSEIRRHLKDAAIARGTVVTMQPADSNLGRATDYAAGILWFWEAVLTMQARKSPYFAVVQDSLLRLPQPPA